jgi:hypothetical protein
MATRGAPLAHVCRVVRFKPLQGRLLIIISVTPSKMGDGLIDVFKRRILHIIVMKLYEW